MRLTILLIIFFLGLFSTIKEIEEFAARPTIESVVTSVKIVSGQLELKIIAPAGAFILVEQSTDLITWEYAFTFIMKSDKVYLLYFPMATDKLFLRCSLPKVK